MRLYYSKRVFKLWTYIVSHSSLLIRSEMKYPDQENYKESTSFNIDLEFWAVSYIDIPTTLYEIEIKEITEEELPLYINRNLLKFYLKIFQLLSNKNKYYIIAGGLLIGKNKWTVQDGIINFSSNLEHDEVIFQS